MISRPKLSERLLIRPAFQFLHDIVRELVSAYQQPDTFQPDELEKGAISHGKLKVKFLTKLIEWVISHSPQPEKLALVQPRDIVAGRQCALTNMLLQELAQSVAKTAKVRRM